MTDTETTAPKSGEHVDRLGAFASTACAIHCAMCAFIPATFAALGLDFLIGHEAEWALTLFAVALGLVALAMGWRRHGNTLVLVTLSVGIIALLAARLLEGGHHDEHHDGAAHSTGEAGEHHADAKEAKPHGEKHGEEDEHEGGAHMAAEFIGIGGGLILMAGHLSNLGAMRSRRREDGDDGCEPDC